MSGVQQYLPSAQFALIVVAVALSGGLVFAAEKITNPNPPQVSSATVVATPTTNNWQQMLRDIQAQNSAYTLPPPPSENAVQNLLTAAKTNNVTDSVGRSLLINLSSAKAQGLGSDIPTQDQLISSAIQQVSQERGAPTYTTTDLQVVANTPQTLKAYGNDLMAVMTAHPDASYYQTLLAIGYATDNQDSTKLAPLTGIGQAYSDVAKALLTIPVPQTLTPLHLQIVNDFARIAQTYPDMQQLLSDPLRGLAAIQLYESLMQETGRVFTNIAQQFVSDGILFTTDEPGHTWGALLPS